MKSDQLRDLRELTTDPRAARLAAAIDRLDGGIVVAFSGGVDSALLLKACVDVHGERVIAVTAESESLPETDRADSELLARAFGARHRFVRTEELADARYRKNAPDRCYFCKHELFDTLAPIARELGFTHLAFGANRDDAGEFRPGHRAAAEFDVKAPLLDAGLGKDDVRDLSRALGIRVWDKPASACLSSRVAYGIAIDTALLQRLQDAERFLHGLGYAACRVRHHGGIVRIELPKPDLARAITEHGDAISAEMKRLGWTWVSLDVEGLRSGSMNAALARQ